MNKNQFKITFYAFGFVAALISLMLVQNNQQSAGIMTGTIAGALLVMAAIR